jgi:hypothetical protein
VIVAAGSRLVVDAGAKVFCGEKPGESLSPWASSAAGREVFRGVAARLIVAGD